MQPKIALEKSCAHFFLVNCSGVMALHIKKKYPSRDNFARWPQVLMREQTTSEQNRRIPAWQTSPTIALSQDLKMCRLGESSPPSPHFLCSRTLVCPKKPRRSHSWGTSSYGKVLSHSSPRKCILELAEHRGFICMSHTRRWCMSLTSTGLMFRPLDK